MPEGWQSIENAFASYDRKEGKERAAEAERERKEVIDRFPLEQWPTMPLERYALGQEESEDTFCRWMEFRTRHLGGIGGGAARKLVIYKHRNKPGWYFDQQQYKDEQEAWQSVREAFVQAFQKAKVNDWDTIDDLIPLQGGPAIRLKALHLYFPSDIIPIYSQDHIRHFLRLLGRREADDRALGAVRLNRALREEVGKHAEFEGWALIEVMQFLYRWADPREQKRVVKIAPGQDAKYWDDCRREGYICVGWDSVGDLREFESKDSFRARFEQEFAEGYNNHKPTLKKKANEVWTLRELEPGDIVIANRGTSHILAVGEVVEPGYTWDPDRPEYRHTVRVKWDTISYPKDIPPQKKWAFVTVSPVSAALYKEIVGEAKPPIPVDPIYRDIAEALQRKGQVILYGPPGTGKTYHARRLAIAWLLQNEGRASEAQAVLSDSAKFAAAERDLSSVGDETVGALTWLTFHPSYSYEDFVEGFRPIDGGNGTLSLRLVDGVFKRVCHAAFAQPSKTFLLLIDEINRANLGKVFGELIMLLEVDKREMLVTLPQSKTRFCIPRNVYLLGTMNTADRSIKLLDAALRRRFAFVEVMPDIEVLRGAKVGTLALDDFLEELNRRIANLEGREKQIGHSFLLDGNEPIADPEEFARRFRQEILPLLQEYCYDDYSALAMYIGDKLVDKEGQTLDHECLGDADALLEALVEEFGPRQRDA